jgi:hypothetical protein
MFLLKDDLFMQNHFPQPGSGTAGSVKYQPYCISINICSCNENTKIEQIQKELEVCKAKQERIENLINYISLQLIDEPIEEALEDYREWSEGKHYQA